MPTDMGPSEKLLLQGRLAPVAAARPLSLLRPPPFSPPQHLLPLHLQEALPQIPWLPAPLPHHSETEINSVHTGGIVKTSRFTRGVFVKIGDFVNFKRFFL